MESVEQRINLKFYIHLGKSTKDAFEMFKHVYGSETISRMQDFEWHHCFREGRETAEDDIF